MRFENLLNLVNSPWAITQDKLATIMGIFNSKLNVVETNAKLEQAFLLNKEKSTADRWNLQLVNSNIAVMDLEGVFVSKTMGMSPLCGMIPTLGLLRILNELETDESIETVVLKIDSGGGSITNIPEVSKFIGSMKTETIAFIDNAACSAAYWIASACKTVVASPSAIVGSIGVYLPVTKKISTDSDKYETTYFKAGENKLNGALDIPFTEKEKKDFQEMVNTTYDWFTGDVSGNRNVSVEKVKSTEASIYKAVDAPEWMVDKVMDSVEFDKLLNS